MHLSEYTDLYVIREILVDGEYELPPSFDPRRIVDLGSNIGISVLYFRARYPHATVLAVEVDRAALRVLRRNVGPDPCVVIHEIAIGARDGARRFVESNETWRSSLETAVSPDGRGRQVQVRSLASLLSDISWDSVDLIKIDIEGGEWEVFERADLTVCRGWIVGELHGTDADRTQSLSTTFEQFDLETRPSGVFLARRVPTGAGIES